MENCAVSLLTRLYHWFLKFRKPTPLQSADISATMARDIGVSVTRVRLPSGIEIVIIERTLADE